MAIRSVPVTAFSDRRPGTSGLRKKVAPLRRPGYLEASVQSIFDALPEAAGEAVAGKALVPGGDGRFFNDDALQTIIRMSAANGVGRRLVARDGLPSTPAAGAVIRKHGCFGDGSRIVCRLSGTGTEGATLRVYLERYELDLERHALASETALAPLAAVADGLADIAGITGRNQPSVVA